MNLYKVVVEETIVLHVEVEGETEEQARADALFECSYGDGSHFFQVKDRRVVETQLAEEGYPDECQDD